MTSASQINWTKVDGPDIAFQPFPSRRSVVYGTKGMVSSSQPLATAAGLEILNKGGNAGKCFAVISQVILVDHTTSFA